MSKVKVLENVNIISPVELIAMILLPTILIFS